MQQVLQVGQAGLVPQVTQANQVSQVIQDQQEPQVHQEHLVHQGLKDLQELKVQPDRQVLQVPLASQVIKVLWVTQDSQELLDCLELQDNKVSLEPLVHLEHQVV